MEGKTLKRVIYIIQHWEIIKHGSCTLLDLGDKRNEHEMTLTLKHNNLLIKANIAKDSCNTSICYFLKVHCTTTSLLQKIYKRQRNQRSNCQNTLNHWKSMKVPEKTSALLTVPKSLTVWITTNCDKFLKRWEHQTTWPASWEICMQIKKQQLELDMEQQTGSKSGKE